MKRAKVRYYAPRVAIGAAAAIVLLGLVIRFGPGIWHAMSWEPQEGTVVEKVYHRAWDQWIPASCIMHDSNGNCTAWNPAHTEHHDQWWEIKVEDCTSYGDGKCHTGGVAVDQLYYDRVHVGDHWTRGD